MFYKLGCSLSKYLPRYLGMFVDPSIDAAISQMLNTA